MSRVDGEPLTTADVTTANESTADVTQCKQTKINSAKI